MKIAFFAPMKPPDHPTPSGDRRMGRQLMAALAHQGHDVMLASRTRFFDRAGAPDLQSRFERNGRQEAHAFVRQIEDGDITRPDLWFTYHVYYKAVDWIGPDIAKTLKIPYVVAEASHAAKRFVGPWKRSEERTVEILSGADGVLCMTAHDRECLEQVVPSAHLHDLPPFVYLTGWPSPPDRSDRVGPPVILAVGMMRPGDKLESYKRLANALTKLVEIEWTLHVAGDGPERRTAESLFEPISGRVVFRGKLDAAAMQDVYAEADLYAWPGAGEAYGMAYLEAQAMGLPVVAQDIRGVSSTVRPGATALLAPDGDTDAYVAALKHLLTDQSARRRMGGAAATFARQERSLTAAAERIDAVLADLVHSK